MGKLRTIHQHLQILRPSVLGGGRAASSSRHLVCHRDPSDPPPPSKQPRRPSSAVSDKAIIVSCAASAPPPPADQTRVCHGFLEGTCSSGDKCTNGLHTLIISNTYSLLTPLHGHEKAVTGIALPSGSDKLFSGSKDETVRQWDCHTGKCIAIVPVGGPVGCVASIQPWLLVGIPGTIKAWNTHSGTHLNLNAGNAISKGEQVYALVEGNGFLFAGTQYSNGDILSWKLPCSSTAEAEATAEFVAAPPLVGHQRAVVSLTVRGDRLYSGSIDTTIRVWDLTTMKCLQTLTQHTHVVTSLMCWGQFLLSCSLDQTIRAWAPNSAEKPQLLHTHTEEDGLLALQGVKDLQEGKDVLLCSCNDNTVRLYNLPSFSPRGKIFSKKEVRAIGIGPFGQFFTGDASGDLKVWKPCFAKDSSSSSSSTSS